MILELFQTAFVDLLEYCWHHRVMNNIILGQDRRKGNGAKVLVNVLDRFLMLVKRDDIYIMLEAP